jgi:hypothetical protein
VGISLTERKNIITDFSNFSFLLKLRKVRILITLTVVAGASILLLFFPYRQSSVFVDSSLYMFDF